MKKQFEGRLAVMKPRQGARVVRGSTIHDLLKVATGQVPLPASFQQFIALWEAFNCWLRIPPQGVTLVSQRSDHDLVLGFAANPMAQESFWRLAHSSSQYELALENLKQLSPVYEVRGVTPTSRSQSIDDEQDLAQVMKVIYQIRNNLFHGAKSWNVQRDEELIRAAHEVLLPFFMEVFQNPEATCLK